MVQGIETLQPPAREAASSQVPDDAVRQLGQAFSNLSEDEIESLRELADDLREMTPDQLTALKQVIDFLNRRSDQYDTAVQAVIRQGIVEPGDLPPDYDPVFFSILSSMVDDAISGGQEQRFAKGGIASLNRKAKRLAKAGRKGDTMLAHLSPESAKALKSVGGSGTINPETGLKEYSLFGSIGNFLKKAAGVVLPIALGLTPLGPIFGAAIGSGIGAMINGASPSQALTAGLIGGAGGALFSGAQSVLGGGSFMQGVTGALPSGMQAMFSAPATAGAAVTPSTGVSSVTGMRSEAAMAASPSATAAASPSMFQSAKDWIAKNPMYAVGGAGLAGLALASAMQEEKTTKGISSQGATPEQIAAARFSPGTFAVYQAPKVNVVPTYSPAYAAQGGEIDARRGGHLSGPGTGTSDSIPARLSDGEFVMTAKAVRGAGDGSRMKGAKRMYDMMHKFEKRA